MTSPATASPQTEMATMEHPLKGRFRDAMARLAAAVNIVTTDGPGGLAGFAATAVCSVSDTPPSLLVCINRNSSAYAPLIANGVLCVNVTHGDHQDLCNLFGGKTPIDERFAGATWSTPSTGAAVLDNALESFDCKVCSVSSMGSHDIVLCEVVALKDRSNGAGLVYVDRQYRVI
jgi:flavin reductase